MVAYDGGMRHIAHGVDKVIGGTVAVAVGKHHHGLLPAYAIGRLYIDRLWLREIAVAFASLVAHIAD